VFFGFLSLWGGFFRFRCMTPPSPLLETLFSASFSWEGSWILLSGVFSRREMYFYVFFSRRVISGVGMMVAYVFLRNGHVVAPHSHESEQ
jgi:hypothetical protein